MSSQPRAWPAADVIVGRRITLTPVRESDAADVAKALDDSALHTYIGGKPATAEQLLRRFAVLVVGRSPDGSEGWLNWVIRDTASGAVVGTAQATLHHEPMGVVAAVAWVVAGAWQGRGLAKEAALALTDWLWAHDVREIAAYIHPEHAASAGVARSIGMAPTDAVVDGEIRWLAVRP